MNVTTNTHTVLQEAQVIVDKYKEVMSDGDYLTLCNANRTCYRRVVSPDSVNSRRAQVPAPTEEIYQSHRARAVESLNRTLEELRAVPRVVSRVTPLFKRRVIEALARDLGIENSVRTYSDLKELHPELKHESELYMSVMPVLNKRWKSKRNDLRYHIKALRLRIAQIDNRLASGYGTSFFDST